MISGDVISEAYTEIVAKNLLEDGVCSYTDASKNTNVIMTGERYKALMDFLDEALGQYVDVGLRDAEAGRESPAEDVVAELRRKHFG